MMKKIRALLGVLGPGLITGASDDDPSGIATYAQTGAQLGYGQLWAALFTIPLMSVIQEICGRIGVVTGKGLAGLIRSHYGRPVLYVSVSLLLVANVINIGADLGAMAEAVGLVLHVPFIALLLASAALIVGLEVFVPYEAYARVLKFAAFLLAAYVAAAFFVKQDWAKVAYSTFIPSFSANQGYITNIVALLGTSVSPYLFFWQVGEEVEEAVASGRLRQIGAGIPRVTRRNVRDMRLDTTVGMVFSNAIMWFVMLTTAATLHTHHVLNVSTADQVAVALKPLAGTYAFALFALGIVGSGLLAVPVLAGSASYAIAETFGWREGLYRKPYEAYRFYAIIAIATIIGLLVNLTPVRPFQMLYYAAILNGVCSAPLMVLIMLIGNSRKVMRKYKNSRFSNVAGWIATGIVTVAAIALLVTLL